jgi:hypothetical protein
MLKFAMDGLNVGNAVFRSQVAKRGLLRGNPAINVRQPITDDLIE